MAKKRSGNPRKRRPKQRSAKSTSEKPPQPQSEKKFDRKVMLERISKAMLKHDKTSLDCFLYSLCVLKLLSETGDKSDKFFDEISNPLIEMWSWDEDHVFEKFLEYKKQKQASNSRETIKDDPLEKLIQSDEDVVFTILEDTATKLLELDIQDREISPSK
ncbi:uncharacterized protein CXQ87_001433 [Candidozyma duobushaemuli]|uniref:Uncharacterized protein n=1 Tax=Candidozyma duobushaemuli TaxID=1231522 RepID=A0A2V1AL99_9ASCO|nr:uncharacterized protein CXQ87_001433 [[Candida] duobushaemulonis]PVH18502.1 hypothetical protein CXQ87_001433 [[Candida] duobushaemulonis]